ncbi:LamG-like jellyroll fold domain-containing protein [Nocardiopsis changdeensis]|uniref:LamG domain-containing protein n=1 Tax=Nocardiopsis changdeensis TaxID=2831969 RepID=A0ABX8BJ60_9ACTN|nr:MULTISPECIES: LamG-like jellyroll fold domain-containing protein [Nocardiopsis]QUX22136.1 LamG domain-containing protein [Nocardiopsis changdeensis]QYX38075.1 LamG domain-containing protein [Nocardiopsis sp. MT53]
MRRSLARATAVSTAAALALSLLAVPPAWANEDEDPAPAEDHSAIDSAEQDALALARETGEPVEITALTDEKTIHYANPDGTLTAEISALPVRVRSGDEWVDADTTLIAGSDGLVRPRAAGMDIAFSGGGDAPMASIGIGSNSIELDWNGPLPTPVLDGDQATYPDVLPDVDLVLTAGVEGFTQVLVVHTPEAAALPELAEIELPLDTTGVTLTSDEHGNIEAVGDEGGQGVFSVQAPAMWDSTGVEETRDEDPTVAPTTGARTALVETDITVDSIRLLPDREMLTGEDTEFPLYIDPSVNANRPNWGFIDKTFPNQAYYNPSDGKPVGVGYYSGGEGTFTRRAFFQFTVMGRTNQADTVINSATLRTEVSWSYDCKSNSRIQLHRVDAFNSKTTWNNQPTARTLLDTQNVGGSWATCPATSGVEFDATAAYKWGVDNDASHIHLRLKEEGESSTTAWRRFDVKNKPPVLVVNYNNPPAQVATSSMSDSLGGACSTDKTKPRLINNTTTNLRATIRDYDARAAWGGQKLKVAFSWSANGEGTPLGQAESGYADVGYWPNGSERSVKVTGLPEGQLLGYRARAHDQAAWGAWSGWCWIKIDTTKPDTGPTVTSTDYPADEEAHGSVGRTGDFTFTNNGVEGAASYYYSLNDTSCETKVSLSAPGASATIALTPNHSGANMIYARTVDEYGNSSPCELAYYFLVSPPSRPLSHFTFDEGQGTTAVDSVKSDRNAVSSGELDWTRGRVGRAPSGGHRLEGTAVDVSGGSHLRTDGPVVDTSGAFSVSAWVYLDESPTENLAAVAQDGDRNSGFYLGYQHTEGGRWVFKQAPSDSDSVSVSHRAISTSAAETGVWTHLLGTFDPANGELALYVNGDKQATATQTTPWNADGDFVVSGARYHGNHIGTWLGAIDDVRVWDRVVSDEVYVDDPEARSEVWSLANRPIALEGRWRLDETEGTAVADSSDHGLTATLHGDPLTAWNEAMNDVTFAPGVSLNAVGQEHIRTEGPALRTDRSMSVAAWVRLDEVGINSTAVSQDGQRHSGFYLGYNTGPEKWVFKQAPYDGDGTSISHRAFSQQQAEFGRWTHIAGTYDHTTGELTLYVDGIRQSTVVQESPWNAFGAVVIGAAQYRAQLYDEWSGDISDVHLYHGVLSESEILTVLEGIAPAPAP